MKMTDRRNRFFEFLSRIISSEPLVEEDVATISHLAVNRRDRQEEPIDRTDIFKSADKFHKSLTPFQEPNDGLQSFGWRLIDNGPVIDGGTYGGIKLVYKLTDRKVPLESRHLAIGKHQPISIPDIVWKEVMIMRGVVHENIIYLFGVFVTLDEFWLVMEYADAGDLHKELKRYEFQTLPKEKNVRFYIRQICAGVAYLHSKEIAHSDLHPGNILLKYNRDASKTCLLCDFGLSLIFDKTQVVNRYRFEPDVDSVRDLAYLMIRRLSPEARIFIDHEKTSCFTITDLMKFQWMKGPSKPAIPKSPTPLLREEVVHRIGYLPQVHATGAAPTPPLNPEPRDETADRRSSLTDSSYQSAVSGASYRSASSGSSFLQRTRHAIQSIPRRLRSISGSSRRPSVDETSVRETPAADVQTPASDTMRSRVQSLGQMVRHPFRRSSHDPQ